MKTQRYYTFANCVVMDLNKHFEDCEVKFEEDYIYISSDKSENKFRVSAEKLFYCFTEEMKENDAYTYKSFIEDFISNISDNIGDESCEENILTKDFKKWENVKDHIIVNPIPLAKTNGRDIYKSFADIAIVIHIFVGSNDNMSYSFRPLNTLLDVWGKTKDEVFNVAFENTNALFPVRIADSSDILNAMSIDDFKEKFKECKEKKYDPAPIAVTRKTFSNGATSIFVNGVLNEIADTLDDDLYVCFTSRHESIIHTLSSGININDIKDVLIDTIKETTLPEDFLSYSIFKYSRYNEISPLVKVL